MPPLVTKPTLLSRLARHTSPPGPRGTLLAGNLRDLRRDPLRFLMTSTLRYGDIVSYRFAFLTGYLLNHPDYIKYVLQDHSQNFNKASFDYKPLKWILGEGLLTSDGTFWLRQRRLVQPAFHRKRIATFGTLITDATAAMLAAWQPFAARGQPLNIAGEMMRLTLRIVGEALFGTDVSDKVDVVGRSFTALSEDIITRIRSLVIIPPHLPLPRNRRFQAELRALDEVVYAIIDERRRQPEDTGDLLSMLLLARDEETGEQMDNRQLRDEVLTLLLAGHETTANALAWTWYLLSKHPAVARRLQTELVAVLGGRRPTVDDLPNLTYTRMVLEETLRLYPPAWITSRNVLAADTIGGYRIPARTTVFLSPYTMHRHPAFWENPEGFDPERFTSERSAARPRFAYFPFGGGPRMCIGNNFALMEMQLILATVAQHYQLQLVPGHPVEPEPLITLRPRQGILMTLHRRHQDASHD